MKLKVYSLPTCTHCTLTKRISIEVASEYGLDFAEVDLSTSDGERDALLHAILSVPTIAFGDDIITRGRFITKEKLRAEIKKRINTH